MEWESPERTFLTLQGLDHTQIEYHWKIFASNWNEKSLKIISDKSKEHNSKVWQIIDNYFWLPGSLETFAPISYIQQNIFSGTLAGLQLLHKKCPKIYYILYNLTHLQACRGVFLSSTCSWKFAHKMFKVFEVFDSHADNHDDASLVQKLFNLEHSPPLPRQELPKDFGILCDFDREDFETFQVLSRLLKLSNIQWLIIFFCAKLKAIWILNNIMIPLLRCWQGMLRVFSCQKRRFWFVHLKETFSELSFVSFSLKTNPPEGGSRWAFIGLWHLPSRGELRRLVTCPKENVCDKNANIKWTFVKRKMKKCDWCNYLSRENMVCCLDIFRNSWWKMWFVFIFHEKK